MVNISVFQLLCPCECRGPSNGSSKSFVTITAWLVVLVGKDQGQQIRFPVFLILLDEQQSFVQQVLLFFKKEKRRPDSNKSAS